MREFRVGQRWLNEAEPELGLGLVAFVGEREVELLFEASESRRRYAKATAPLRRVRFRAGDPIRVRDGERLAVVDVEERDGILTYVGADRRVVESDLSPLLGTEDPGDRLRAGRLDPLRLFALRQEAIAHLGRARASEVRGLVGARIDLLPHQIFIASEVAGREAPRVLLADEVGLGKTIEACLVVHRLLLSGRAERALVIVPEHLVHQWFVELLRRFNLQFRIFDEERCAAIEVEGGDNPFLDEQLVLCALPLLAGDGGRGEQAIAAGWDLLVVDEAHHLGWRPQAASPEYRLVEGLAARADGVLLLTGTPAQLGEEGHFARLHLLDPARHPDLERYRSEVAAYEEVARNLARLSEPPDHLPDDGSIVSGAPDPAAEDAILDRYGPGRVMFRNTRASVGGFPRRVLEPAPLAGPHDAEVLAQVAHEIDLRARRAAGTEPVVATSYLRDPRVAWLAGLLRRLAPEKILVITQTPAQVVAIADALAREVTVKRAVFHEELSLVQRDRNAAYFAEEDGARLLLCSEIGSEGRNFQFAHHLVLFDLPLDPELLEQRIGRLDRIGQRSAIAIHVPYLVGSAQEVLFRWFDEGLDAFGRPLADGNALYERFAARVADLARRAAAEAASDAELEQILCDSRTLRDQLADRLGRGRDALLERSSFRAHRAAALVAEIARQDADHGLEELMQRVFDHFGVETEDLGRRTHRLSADRLYVDVFPGLPAEGLTVTFSRAVALEREEVAFLTADHPMVLGALELLSGSAAGTSAAASLPSAGRGMILDASFAIETPAPRRLGLERFLPPSRLRVALDQELVDRTADVERRSASGELRDSPALLDGALGEIFCDRLPALLARAREVAEERTAAAIEQGVARARALLAPEIERLTTLARVNDEVRPVEIERLEERLREVVDHLRRARPRLDAVRVLGGDAARIGESARAIGI